MNLLKRRVIFTINKGSGVWALSLEFQPRDMWVGLFWCRDYIYGVTCGESLSRIYVCLIPCFPLVFAYRKVNVKL